MSWFEGQSMYPLQILLDHGRKAMLMRELDEWGDGVGSTRILRPN